LQRHRRLQQLWQVLLASTALPGHLQAAADAPSLTLLESSQAGELKPAPPPSMTRWECGRRPARSWPRSARTSTSPAARMCVPWLQSRPVGRTTSACLCEAVYSAKPKLRVCCACCFSARLSLRRMGRAHVLARMVCTCMVGPYAAGHPPVRLMTRVQRCGGLQTFAHYAADMPGCERAQPRPLPGIGASAVDAERSHTHGDANMDQHTH